MDGSLCVSLYLLCQVEILVPDGNRQVRLGLGFGRFCHGPAVVTGPKVLEFPPGGGSVDGGGAGDGPVRGGGSRPGHRSGKDAGFLGGMLLLLVFLLLVLHVVFLVLDITSKDSLEGPNDGGGSGSGGHRRLGRKDDAGDGNELGGHGGDGEKKSGAAIGARRRSFLFGWLVGCVVR